MADKAHEPLVLSTGERNRLTEWAAQAHGRQAVRASIVLACADGKPDTHVAAQAGVSRATVAKWRARFAATRLARLRGGYRAKGTPGRAVPRSRGELAPLQPAGTRTRRGRPDAAARTGTVPVHLRQQPG